MLWKGPTILCHLREKKTWNVKAWGTENHALKLFPWSSISGFVDNRRGKNGYLPASNQRHWTGTFGLCSRNQPGTSGAPKRRLELQSQHMGLEDFSTVWKRHGCLFLCQSQGACSDSRELIKSLERRQQLGEKAVGSFPPLCWVLAWATLLTSGWMQLKDSRGLWHGRIWL